MKSVVLILVSIDRGGPYLYNGSKYRGIRRSVQKIQGGSCNQGFEIHGSTGAPLPEKNTYGRKIRRIIEKKSPQKKKRGVSECRFCFLIMA